MKQVKHISYLSIFIYMLLFPSCKTQCQILEEQIDLCETYLDCSQSDEICTEVQEAKSLIQTINAKITDGTDDKTNVEDICSFAISEINVNNCIDAQELKKTNWQDIKNLMSNFGLFSTINEINREIDIKTIPNIKTPLDENNPIKCGEKILKDYSSLEEDNKQIGISIMRKFSEEVVPMMQIYKSSTSSNIFIGDKYIKNGDSPCDFNRGNRLFGTEGKNDYNYKDYDYIFCSKSSGWLSETQTTQSNCALTRQEVFLINWKSDYFMKWCNKNYKNTSSYCKNGNDYKCIYETNKKCYELRESFFCKNNYDICSYKCDENRFCQTLCDEEYLECKSSGKTNNCKIRCQIDKCYPTNVKSLYECLEVSKDKTCCDYSNCDCSDACNDSSDSKDCKVCKGICCFSGNTITISSCYNLENIADIENCFYKEITESTNDIFNTCIAETEAECNESCQVSNTICENGCNYDTCIYTCLEKECSDYDCFERSSSELFKDDSCNNHSCYYNCQEKCGALKIDSTKSTIMTVYREVDDEITGSNCDETEIFGTDESYCIIEHEIIDEEEK